MQILKQVQDDKKEKQKKPETSVPGFFMSTNYENLFNFKDLAAVKQLVNSLNLCVCNCIVNLLLQLGFISCIVNATDNADCQRVSHLSKQVVDARILGCHIVNQNILFGNAVFTNLNDLEVGTVENKTLVAFLASVQSPSIIR